MPHFPGHLIVGAVALLVVTAIRAATANRLVKRRLRLSLFLLLGYLAINLFVVVQPALAAQSDEHLRAFERLALAAAIINALVFVLVNPFRHDRVPESFPTILQDAIVLGLVLGAGMFLSAELVTTSAVSAVVLGFALQDTLGNAFAGLAIQSEKPFSVGHWVAVGSHEGRVAEVTWRATKLRTKSGNLVILPNNFLAKEPIVNYSEPAAPTRVFVEVGASYLTPPNVVKAAMLEAVRHASLALAAPAPDVVLVSFDASAITYRARFWIQDFESDERARDQVRTAIYYSFKRHGIDIPWPIQVQYERELPAPNAAAQQAEVAGVLATVEMLAALPQDVRSEIASAAKVTHYGAGEPVVRQGEPGESMFILADGDVRVVLEPGREEVARIGRGGYFGEMSLLTGEPRTATVLAATDVQVIELSADVFRRLGAAHPSAIEAMGVAALTRRAELEKARTVTTGVVTVEKSALLERMKRFLRLGA